MLSDECPWVTFPERAIMTQVGPGTMSHRQRGSEVLGATQKQSRVKGPPVPRAGRRHLDTDCLELPLLVDLSPHPPAHLGQNCPGPGQGQVHWLEL